MTRNLAEAEDRPSEVVDPALSEGPRTITRRGDAVVVPAAARSAELPGGAGDFRPFLLDGPSFEGLDLARDGGPMRDVEP